MNLQKTIIYLVRHGEIDNPYKVMYGGNIELMLNQKGKEDLRKLAKKLKNREPKITAIYTSPMKRAIESSEILREVLGIDSMIIEKDLIDINIQALVGKPISIRNEIHSKGIDEYGDEYVRLGNEPRAEIVNRMIRVFKKVVQENKGKATIILSHGDPIRFLIFKLMSPNEEIPTMAKLVNYDYPEKGTAVKFEIDDNENVTRKEVITP